MLNLWDKNSGEMEKNHQIFLNRLKTPKFPLKNAWFVILHSITESGSAAHYIHEKIPL